MNLAIYENYRRPLTNEPLSNMPIEFEELSGWSFDADEVSAGAYTATEIDPLERKVEQTGTDPDNAIEKCREAALEIVLSLTPSSAGNRP